MFESVRVFSCRKESWEFTPGRNSAWDHNGLGSLGTFIFNIWQKVGCNESELLQFFMLKDDIGEARRAEANGGGSIIFLLVQHPLLSSSDNGRISNETNLLAGNKVLGFSLEELPLVDAQLDDIGIRMPNWSSRLDIGILLKVNVVGILVVNAGVRNKEDCGVQ